MAVCRPSCRRGNSATLLTWLSLLLLLLSCFILLLSMSQVTRVRFDLAVASFRDALGMPPRVRPVVAAGVKPAAGLPHEIGLVRLKEQTEHVLAVWIDQGGVELAETEQGVVVRFGHHWLFDPGTFVLREAVKPSLRQFARLLAAMPNRLRIVGHTDDLPPGSGEAASDSWSLSALSAAALVQMFATEGGMDVRRLEVRGMGQYMPRGDNGTEEGRRRNRRVEVIVSRELLTGEVPERQPAPVPKALLPPVVRP